MHSIAFASISLSLAISNPPVLADDNFCTTIEAVLGFARDDFRSIADRPVDATTNFRGTSFVLPGAETCEILQTAEHAEYWCWWPSTRAILDGQVEALSERIAGCLEQEPDWTGDDFSLSAFIVDSGVEFYVSGEKAREASRLLLAVEFIGEADDTQSGGAPLNVAESNFPRGAPHVYVSYKR